MSYLSCVFVVCLDDAEHYIPAAPNIVINDTSHPKLQADSSLQAITGLHPSRKTQRMNTGTEFNTWHAELR